MPSNKQDHLAERSDAVQKRKKLYGCCFTIKQIRKKKELETPLAIIDFGKTFNSLDQNKL